MLQNCVNTLKEHLGGCKYTAKLIIHKGFEYKIPFLSF